METDRSRIMQETKLFDRLRTDLGQPDAIIISLLLQFPKIWKIVNKADECIERTTTKNSVLYNRSFGIAQAYYVVHPPSSSKPLSACCRRIYYTPTTTSPVHLSMCKRRVNLLFFRVFSFFVNAAKHRWCTHDSSSLILNDDALFLFLGVRRLRYHRTLFLPCTICKDLPHIMWTQHLVFFFFPSLFRAKRGM